jgi:adenylyltransferase/sulfurtransferase
LGIGQSMAGRFLLFDALDLAFQEMKSKKNSDCPLCGENPTIKELIDYTQSCSTRDAAPLQPSTRTCH